MQIPVRTWKRREVYIRSHEIRHSEFLPAFYFQEPVQVGFLFLKRSRNGSTSNVFVSVAASDQAMHNIISGRRLPVSVSGFRGHRLFRIQGANTYSRRISDSEMTGHFSSSCSAVARTVRFHWPFSCSSVFEKICSTPLFLFGSSNNGVAEMNLSPRPALSAPPSPVKEVWETERH